MPSETKTVLTREFCKKQLLAQGDSSGVGFLTVLFLPAFLLPLFLGLAALQVSKALGIFLLAIAAVMLYLGIYTVSSILRAKKRRRRLVEEGRFSIVTDEVAYTVKNELTPPRYRVGQNVIYFKNYGRYVPTKMIFDFTAAGDTFYLVIVEGARPEIALAYHAKIYTDKERSY